MSKFIQTLEQRMLMSVTAATLDADLQAVKTDAAAAVAVHAGRHTAFKNAIDALAADLKAIDTSSNRVSNNRLIAKLRLVDAVEHFKVVIDQNVFLATAKLDSTLGVVHGKALLNHPTSAALQTAVAKDLTRLNTNVPAKLAVLQTELTNATTAFDAVADQIAAANPSLASLISTGESSLGTKTTAASAAAGQVGADTAHLATDLAAIPA